jgi:DNA polymerase III subunit gamma/tau
MGMKSFKSVLAMEEEVNVETNNSPLQQNTHSGQTKEFTKAMAIGALAEFAEGKSTQTEKMAVTRDFDLQKFELIFKLPNKILFDIFFEIKQELTDFLRKKLHNAEIQIEAIIHAEETKAKPRTEQEKFESMAEKNPDIWKLKEVLGLDLLF